MAFENLIYQQNQYITAYWINSKYILFSTITNNTKIAIIQLSG